MGAEESMVPQIHACTKGGGARLAVASTWLEANCVYGI